MVRARSLICARRKRPLCRFCFRRRRLATVRPWFYPKAPNPNHSCLPRWYYSFLYLVA